MADADPFLVTGPTIISFSGGRTSGYMLWRILQAHGGTLPADVMVCFANTGREMPATLDFVHACATHWSVPVHWLEYRRAAATGHVTAVEVNHNSASRSGEPFEQMLGAKGMLPNPVMRFCTSELKIRTIRRWCAATFGKGVVWTQIVGLRADEARRVEKMRDPARRKKSGVEARFVEMPLADAGVTKPDVLAFWKGQPFDLMLAGPWEGNCDGCFLKSKGSILRMLRDHPERMRWWSGAEKLFASTTRTAPNMNLFRADRDQYSKLTEQVRTMPMLPMDETMHELGEACDGGCGV